MLFRSRNRPRNSVLATTLSALAALLYASSAFGQKLPDIGFQSVGRGRPLVMDISQAKLVGAVYGAGGIGGGGLFIESTAPLPVGTKLAMEFSLPEQPVEWIPAKGVVAWVCPKADQYTFSPGMGVRFSDIAPEARERIHAIVKTLEGTGQAA